MNFLIIVFIVLLNTFLSIMSFNNNDDDGVEIESLPNVDDASMAGIKSLEKKFGKQIDNILKPYIAKLKEVFKFFFMFFL